MNLILDALFDIILSALTVVLAPLIALPTATLPSGFLVAFTNMFLMLNVVRPFFPVDTLLVCFALVLSVQVVLVTVKVIRFGKSFIPFMGG